nr:protein sieve element occlusion c [Quercus suber]
MNFLGSDPFWRSPLYLDEDIQIKKLLLTHDPDGRCLDSELFLRAIQYIILYSEVPLTPLVSDLQFDAMAISDESNIEATSSQEPLGHVIYKISLQMRCKWPGEDDLHMRTMFLFDLLGKYKWDAKMVIVLAAFATNYGEFWLLRELCPHNPLAVSVAMLKQLPNDLSTLKPRFKALNFLVKNMVDVTKYIIKFEGLPLSHVELDKEVDVTKSYIYASAYWVTRSALACSSLITDLIAMKPENLDSTIIATWELLSLVCRSSSIWSHLRQQVDLCHEQIERKLCQKLLELFKESPTINNQEVLHMLFASKDALPLKDCSSQAKLGVSELENKVVVLLISKPELLPIEELLFLVQQTYDHPLNKNYKGNYEIVWFPISYSDTWTDDEVRCFNFFSNYLPWCSIRQPWLHSSAVVNSMKQAWNYKGEPLMVVLDSRGMVTNSNAIDMVISWGAWAYPFSASREEQLWEEQNWTMQLLIDNIDPLLASWVEEDRDLCIYGSENQKWIQEFISKMKEIKSTGVQLEMVYVGNRNRPDDHVRNIVASIAEEKLTGSLSFTTTQFFWLRLESMRRSKLRLRKTADNDHILDEVSALLDFSDSGWAVIGKGSSSTDIVQLQGKELMQRLNLFSQWGNNVAKLGFSGAIRSALEPPSLPGPCSHSTVIPYAEGLIEGTVICEKCKRPMKKFFVYE